MVAALPTALRQKATRFCPSSARGERSLHALLRKDGLSETTAAVNSIDPSRESPPVENHPAWRRASTPFRDATATSRDARQRMETWPLRDDVYHPPTPQANRTDLRKLGMLVHSRQMPLQYIP